jgi:guanine deaminase
MHVAPSNYSYSKAMITENDRKFLEIALDIAGKNIFSGGGPFGAVIVKGDMVVAQSGNRVVADADPTAHAEVLAIRKASASMATHILDGCVLYTSCEPCPMCLGAIYWSGIKRVVYSATREDAAVAGFSDQHIYNEVALEPAKREVSFLSLDREKGRQIFEEWIRFPGKLPY